MPDQPISGTWRAIWGTRSQYGKEKQWTIACDTDHEGVICIGLDDLDDLVEPHEAAATATLMAASKELLEACQGAIKTLTVSGFSGPLCDKLQSAIAKATTVDRSVGY